MNFLILLPIIFPFVASFVGYLFKDNKRNLKCLIIAILVFLTLASCILNCFIPDLYLPIVKVSESLSFALKVDGISKFFSVAIATIWLIVTIYNFEYIKHEGAENRFYLFMYLTLSVLIGMTYAANIVTMYLFYEMVTLASMPLVLHSLSKESINAALKYLFYSIGGAFLALFGVFFIASYCNNADFGSWGGLEVFKNFEGNKTLYQILILFMMIGFGTKAGMFPMHGWLPIAHPVAPSSASALLSGAITKAGIIAIIRVIYYYVGPDFIAGSAVQYIWLSLALFTVFLGSFMAFLEKNLKKRLAFSSVSQISYIICGLALLTKTSFTGALLHFIAHMSIKVTLFLFAGNGIFKYNYRLVSEYKGIGKKMPISTWCYTIASLGLIGIPLTSGFVSKWYLATGAINSNTPVFSWLVPVILLVSAILTAGYLFPISIFGFFVPKDEVYTKDEVKPMMYIPLMILAFAILFIGIYSQPIVNFISQIIGG